MISLPIDIDKSYGVGSKTTNKKLQNRKYLCHFSIKIRGVIKTLVDYFLS